MVRGFDLLEKTCILIINNIREIHTHTQIPIILNIILIGPPYKHVKRRQRRQLDVPTDCSFDQKNAV